MRDGSRPSMVRAILLLTATFLLKNVLLRDGNSMKGYCKQELLRASGKGQRRNPLGYWPLVEI